MEPGKCAEVREQLDRILADASFSGANRRSRLLRYLVEEALEDRSDGLKESVIATEVFDRPPDYDPKIDSVVRVEVGRLRARLAEYYVHAGPNKPVRIEIPRGRYRPVFVFRENAPAAQEQLVPKNSNWKKWAAAGIVCAGVVLAVWRFRTLAAPATPVAIAVLPFLNLSGNAGDEYLSDGISEELTQNLAGYNDLRVVARTSAFQYKGKNADVREIGRSLRAGALLEGSIARRAGQFHVVAQLIRTSDGYHLWAHTYETTLADLPGVEESIARASRERLAPTSVAAGTEPPKTRSPEAHDLYMRSVYELNQRTEASTRRSLELAQQAADKDPTFAQPYVVMAAGESQLTTLLAQFSRSGAERAWVDVAKALALDPANSGAHAQKALLAYTDHWDWPQAEREFQLALKDGSHGSAENLYGWYLTTRGRFAEARRRLQAAAELDPLSLGPQLNQVEELFAERKYGEAKQKVEQVLSTSPGNPVGLVLATSIAFWQKDCASASAASNKLLKLYPQAPGARMNALGAEYICGHEEQSKKEAAELFRQPAGSLSPYAIAGTLAYGNDADQAMIYLERSAEVREPRLLQVKVDRVFDGIRKDARFIALERKLGLLD